MRTPSIPALQEKIAKFESFVARAEQKKAELPALRAKLNELLANADPEKIRRQQERLREQLAALEALEQDVSSDADDVDGEDE